jgi:DNA-binding CsgD family transcriptional regulator
MYNTNFVYSFLFSKNHITNVLGKLGARDRAQAALIAKDLGII